MSIKESSPLMKPIATSIENETIPEKDEDVKSLSHSSKSISDSSQ